MTNQNPAPFILREDFIVQTNSSSGKVQINHNLDIGDEFDIYAIQAEITPGNWSLGNIDNNEYGYHSFTHTDIADPYIDNRPDDYQEYPICCEPRTWQDLDLNIYDAENAETPVHQHPIDLAIINHHSKNMLKLACPIVITYNDALFLDIINNNPMSGDRYTYSYVKIGLVGDIINEEQLLRHNALGVDGKKGVWNNEPTGIESEYL